MIFLHVIPVPFGWSAEQAWEFISRGRKLTRRQQERIDWAIIEVDSGGRFLRERVEDDGA